ncbi:hypothetical protein [Pseudoruegeria sp. SHC-113]|uniref:hypothetical protein n=1 Tax=Pseudoruegeria sp. SHC-113 TaxID=2855439 RepID=UPI0021BB5A62|nr:hypothetical protein [Pseudoruegeria sp. SHC-113]MCT8160367.1 hypothetical protein [Pseudoruegeria sp. SHC-113]
MNHTIAIAASFASLGLLAAIYACNVLSHPESWLRKDLPTMILLALFTGIFPLALTATGLGLWTVATNGLSLATLLAAGTDLAAFVIVVATTLLFRALLRNTRLPGHVTVTVAPAAPRPANTPGAPSSVKHAA